MNKIVEIASKALSILLYPLFIPAYGMLLLWRSYSHITALPDFYWGAVILSTLLITCIIPLTAIIMLRRKGTVSTLYIEKASERTTPYLYTTLSFAFWCLLLYKIGMPTYLLLSAIGATVALIGITVINRRWKISAHLTGMGGLIGGIMSFYMGIDAMPPIWLTVILLVAALLLMYARLYLKAHSSLQVVIGLLWGLLCTFVPNLIMYYAL